MHVCVCVCMCVCVCACVCFNEYGMFCVLLLLLFSVWSVYLSSIYGYFWIRNVTMESDCCSMLEWKFFRTDLEKRKKQNKTKTGHNKL